MEVEQGFVLGQIVQGRGTELGLPNAVEQGQGGAIVAPGISEPNGHDRPAPHRFHELVCPLIEKLREGRDES